MWGVGKGGVQKFILFDRFPAGDGIKNIAINDQDWIGWKRRGEIFMEWLLKEDPFTLPGFDFIGGTTTGIDTGLGYTGQHFGSDVTNILPSDGFFSSDYG